ncbi:unnamed protein product [Penicillium pancosmium]
MKFFSLILYSFFLSSVAAYGAKAAWEKILYYNTYLLEEQAFGDDSSKYAVGVGCAGSRPGGRCTFGEFTEYIWKTNVLKNPDGTTYNAPKPAPLPENFPGSGDLKTWLKTNPVTITQRLIQTKYVMNVDGAKVNGEPNYYASLEKIGQDFRRALDATPKVETATQQLVERANLAVRTVEQLRIKDIDSFKVGKGGANVGDLAKILRDKFGDPGFDIVRKDSLEKVVNEPNYRKQLDYSGTIEKYKDEHPNIKAALDDALNTWGSKQTNINHMNAANAATNAKLAMGCT